MPFRISLKKLFAFVTACALVVWLALGPGSIQERFETSLLNSEFGVCNSYIANPRDHLISINPIWISPNYVVQKVQPAFSDYLLFRRPISIQEHADDRDFPGGRTCVSTKLYAHPFSVTVVSRSVDSYN